MVAVLVRSPVKLDGTVTVTLNTTEFPGPAAISTDSFRSPEPLRLFKLAFPLTTADQDVIVVPAGAISATVAPTTSLGPLLLTVTV